MVKIPERGYIKMTTQEMLNATRIAESMHFEPIVNPEICQKVSICINGYFWASDEEKTLYEAIKEDHPDLLFSILTRYAETHGIKWGGIWGCTATHYENKNGGHFVVTGYISGSIGNELGFLANCAEVLQNRN